MTWEKISDGLLHEIAAAHGTPLYVYDAATAKAQFNKLSKAISGQKHLICYAMKANSNLALLKLFHDLGSGFDIVSEGELRRVVAAGGDTRKVVFAGVGKTAQEIEYALGHDIRMFNVESEPELRLIAQIAAKLGKKARVSLRLNPHVSVTTHPYLATGLRTSKFGIPVEEALQLWPFIQSSQSLELVGMDCHIGSQISELQPLAEAYSEVLRVAKLFEEKGAKIQSIDCGGGLGIGFSGHYAPLDIDAFAGMLKRLFKDTAYEIILEPGKYLIAEAGALLTRVLWMKQNHEHRFAVVDAGMNDLIRPALYDGYHKIDLVPAKGEAAREEREVVDVVGPVCETGCFLAQRREMPALKANDLLIVRDAGAYGFTMASNYNSRLLPAEILLLEGAPQIIRQRERYEDLWRNERIYNSTAS